jgi:hypothetical protein
MRTLQNPDMQNLSSYTVTKISWCKKAFILLYRMNFFIVEMVFFIIYSEKSFLRINAFLHLLVPILGTVCYEANKLAQLGTVFLQVPDLKL